MPEAPSSRTGSAGDTVTILTLSGGARGGDVTLRRGEAESAAAIIGARLLMEDLEDTRIRESDPTVSIIERVIGEVKPTIMYTHSVNDVHQDHRNTHSAAMVAARRVPYVLCFQSPSATIDFRPSRFVNIETAMDGKLEAIAAIRDPGHRRATTLTRACCGPLPATGHVSVAVRRWSRSRSSVTGDGRVPRRCSRRPRYPWAGKPAGHQWLTDLDDP